MALFTLSTNPCVTCRTCQHNPVAIISGQQVDQCAPCYARKARSLSEWFGDYWLNRQVDRLDASIELANQVASLNGAKR